jgi:hypothetical protein
MAVGNDRRGTKDFLKAKCDGPADKRGRFEVRLRTRFRHSLIILIMPLTSKATVALVRPKWNLQNISRLREESPAMGSNMYYGSGADRSVRRASFRAAVGNTNLLQRDGVNIAILDWIVIIDGSGSGFLGGWNLGHTECGM